MVGGLGRKVPEGKGLTKLHFFVVMAAWKKIICCHVVVSYIYKANPENFDIFRHSMISIAISPPKKVGGACSLLGTIGPKVGGALAPPALWLPRLCIGDKKRRRVDRFMRKSIIVVAYCWQVRTLDCTLFTNELGPSFIVDCRYLTTRPM